MILWVIAPVFAGADSILDRVKLKHGIAFFHDLKYPPDFTHFDYVNPNAPKNGNFVQATQVNFNTLAPFQERGVTPPSGSGMLGDTLLIRSGDEVSGFYGRLADGIGVTSDGMALVFRLRDFAKWNDGKPITSEDVIYTYTARKAQLQGRL